MRGPAWGAPYCRCAVYRPAIRILGFLPERSQLGRVVGNGRRGLYSLFISAAPPAANPTSKLTYGCHWIEYNASMTTTTTTPCGSAAAADCVSTLEAARELGVRYHRLHALLRDGLIAAPMRDSIGRFQWSRQDVEHARAALAARGRSRLAAALAELHAESANIEAMIADMECETPQNV
jgi:hypothetical protein